MVTSALTGALISLGSSVALAQTTVTGNVALSYQNLTNEGPASQKAKDFHGMGKEAQINITNKGKFTNIGVDYVAGFSIEMDGADYSTNGTGSATVTAAEIRAVTAENTYIDLVMGKTIISFGADHMPNTEGHGLAMHVGYGFVGGDGVSNTVSSISKAAGDPYTAFGAGVIYNADVGQFSVRYIPNADGAAAANDIFNSAAQASTGNAESAISVGFRGGLGVKGLDLQAFKHERKLGNGLDADGRALGLRYTVGALSAGVQELVANAAHSDNTKRVDTTRIVGVSYALTKTISVGTSYAENKRKNGGNRAAGVAEETAAQVGIGYNLGPATVILQYKDAKNVGMSAANDGQMWGVYTNLAF